MLERFADSLALLSAYSGGFVETTLLVVALSIASILVSWIFGLGAALAQESRWRALVAVARFYVWFVRGTPTLIQIFLVYFGLPQFGIRMSPYVAGVLALGVNSGAFVAEIIRSGLVAIPKGQRECAKALGMGWWLSMRLVILPQVLRIVVPPVTNEAITLVKNTSLLSTITVLELTLFSQMAIARTFRPFEFYIAAALIYLALTSLLSNASARLERRFALAR
jgi:polar amino acid transport system permease protein